jgi:hypothetical protein
MRFTGTNGMGTLVDESMIPMAEIHSTLDAGGVSSRH